MARTGWDDKIFVSVIYALLAILAFVTFYPVWNSAVISFNEGSDTTLGGITFWPRKFTLENYEYVFRDPHLLNGFYIAVLRTLVGTVLCTIATAIFGYGMSKRELIGRKYYMIMVIITFYFGGGLIPTYLLIKGLELRDTFWVMIVPVIINGWNMIIFRSFFQELPAGLEESAKIDGAGNWGIFFRIVLPLSGPVMATLGLFTAVGHWNDWFLPSIYIDKSSLQPIQTILQQILNTSVASEQLAQFARIQSVTTKSVIMATMMTATIPIMAVYPFLQRYFVKGVLIGSLKG